MVKISSFGFFTTGCHRGDAHYNFCNCQTSIILPDVMKKISLIKPPPGEEGAGKGNPMFIANQVDEQACGSRATEHGLNCTWILGLALINKRKKWTMDIVKDGRVGKRNVTTSTTKCHPMS